MPVEEQNEAHATASNLGLSASSDTHFTLASFVRAGEVLARQLHEEDHMSSKETALAKREASLSNASALLIQCAVVQSNRGEFNLVEAFDTRLDALRERFGIPRLDPKP